MKGGQIPFTTLSRNHVTRLPNTLPIAVLDERETLSSSCGSGVGFGAAVRDAPQALQKRRPRRLSVPHRMQGCVEDSGRPQFPQKLASDRLAYSQIGQATSGFSADMSCFEFQVMLQNSDCIGEERLADREIACCESWQPLCVRRFALKRGRDLTSMLFSPLGWRTFLENADLLASTLIFSQMLIIQQLIPAAKPEGRPRSLKSGQVANVTDNFARIRGPALPSDSHNHRSVCITVQDMTGRRDLATAL